MELLAPPRPIMVVVDVLEKVAFLAYEGVVCGKGSRLCSR
jgi:hypothetical protein